MFSDGLNNLRAESIVNGVTLYLPDRTVIHPGEILLEETMQADFSTAGMKMGELKTTAPRYFFPGATTGTFVLHRSARVNSRAAKTQMTHSLFSQYPRACGLRAPLR